MARFTFQKLAFLYFAVLLFALKAITYHRRRATGLTSVGTVGRRDGRVTLGVTRPFVLDKGGDNRSLNVKNVA